MGSEQRSGQRDPDFLTAPENTIREAIKSEVWTRGGHPVIGCGSAAIAVMDAMRHVGWINDVGSLVPTVTYREGPPCGLHGEHKCEWRKVYVIKEPTDA